MKKCLSILLCVLFIFCPGCQKKDRIQEQLDKMTLEEKVGQLFIVRPDALTSLSLDIVNSAKAEGVLTVTEEMKEKYAKYPVGGFALFGKNIADEEQLSKLTTDLHALSSIAPLICIDEEGGRITRIASNSNFDVEKFAKMSEIAESEDYDEAYRLGETIGGYLERFGIDVDFAPVADVNTNPNNTVIGSRAFGSDPQVASQMIRNVIEGLHNSNTFSCVKHFPGHGDTANDTHSGYAYTSKTWEELLECELITFKAAIEKGTDMVMIAHIAVPNVTGSDLPSTLSYTIVTEKLRNELGFNGVIITDAMDMGAIANYYTSSESAIMAIQAGVDIVLMSYNYVQAFCSVVEAVNQGILTEERINESVYRILTMKAKLSQPLN